MLLALAPNNLPAEAPRKAAPSPFIYSLYFFSIFLWAFDFKSSGAGAGIIIQLPILLIYFASSVLILVKTSAQTPLPRMAKYMMASVFFFLTLTTICGFAFGQDSWEIMTNIFPLLTFAASIWTTCRFLSSIDPAAFHKSLLKVCLWFMAVHFGVVLIVNHGINLSVSRYQYLSGATIPSSAITAMLLLISLGYREKMTALANLAFILISVTRTQLAIMAGQIFLSFMMYPKYFLRPSALKKISLVGFLFVSVVAVDLTADLGLTERWVTRLTIGESMGADPTALTRKAETSYMLDAFSSSFSHILLGNGLAAHTHLIGQDAALAASLVGPDSVQLQSKGFGHNNYASILFTGGLISGFPLLLMTLLTGLLALRLLRTLMREKADPAITYIGLWSSLSIIGFLIDSALSGTFGERSECLWYGIMSAMFYWARQQVAEHVKKNRPHLIGKPLQPMGSQP